MSRLARGVLPLVFVAALIAFAGPAAEVSAGGLALTVTMTADTNDGVCDADCSLREAITAANGSVATTDTIDFNIPPVPDPGCDDVSGVCTITPATDLPQVTDPVIIDGLTQTGAGTGSLKIQLTGLEEFDSVGIFLKGGDSTIRGLVINHFNWGIQISTAGGNTVRSNYIGTDPTGSVPIGNIDEGLVIFSSSGGNFIGGAGPGEGNVLSGNGGFGLSINQSTSDTVQGNLIGTKAGGTEALPNALGGIRIGNSADTVIGGAGGARNVISGNSGPGIYGGGGSGPAVQGNLIGFGADGTTPLGNSGAGIFDNFPTTFTIGGTGAGEGNVIAFNGDGGVVLPTIPLPGTIPIRGNRIYSNDGLGIDLGSPGPEPNDLGPPPDGDSGPNGLQNYPVINDAVIASGNVTISGALNSAPSTSYRVEFFHNAQCDASGFGEGEVFIGFATVVTDGNGDGPFSAEFPAIAPDRFVTATATDPAGNTSEFGECTPAVIGVLKGDVDCSGGINAVDALKVLRFAASLPITQTEPCPDIGTPLSAGGPEMGDMNCDGNENSVDALLILRHSAGLPVNLPIGCAPIGS